MNKVLLINPPTINNEYIGTDNYFPLGLLYIATTLRYNGNDSQIIDVNNYYYTSNEVINEISILNYVENTLVEYIREYKPDVIGIGSIFSGAFKPLRIIAKRVKETFPHIPIVVGGIIATMFSEEILKRYNYIDYVIIGEGERSFLELIKCITKNRLPNYIDGVAFNDNGHIKSNPKTKFIEDLDALPFVDYDIIDVGAYKMDTSGWYSPKGIKVGQPFPILSSRSCPQKCTFCNMRLVHGSKIRLRSPENVLDEIEYLYNKYNVRYFQFIDDNLTFDKGRIIQICDGILQRDMNIQFDTPNGVSINKLDGEIIERMISAGMIRISLPIESGSEYIRNKIMKKNLRNTKVYEVVNACARHENLWIKGFFIIGMPQETLETLEETYRMIEELPLDNFGIFFATPYPGTDLFNYCLKNRLLPFSAEEYVDVDDLQLGAMRPHFKPHNVTEDDLLQFQEKCYNYMRTKRANSNVPLNHPFCFN